MARRHGDRSAERVVVEHGERQHGEPQRLAVTGPTAIESLGKRRAKPPRGADVDGFIDVGSEISGALLPGRATRHHRLRFGPKKATVGRLESPAAAAASAGLAGLERQTAAPHKLLEVVERATIMEKT